MLILKVARSVISRTLGYMNMFELLLLFSASPQISSSAWLSLEQFVPPTPGFTSLKLGQTMEYNFTIAIVLV